MKRTVVTLALCLNGLVACQTVPYQGQARDVSRKPQEEGTVAIPLNYRDEDRQKAEMKMSQNCTPSPVKILEEGEIAVGQETKSSGRETDRKDSQVKVGQLFGIPITSGEAGGKNTETAQVVTSIKEWQIKYRCLASDEGKSSKKKASM
jgi:hypothetical protein